MKTCIGKRCALADGTGLRFALPVSSTRDQAPGCQPQAFVIEYDGQVFAYENRCPHLGIELDWNPGVFFDSAGEMLLCSTHGARFEPDTGKCVSGPCAGQGLKPVAVAEEQGELYISAVNSS